MTDKILVIALGGTIASVRNQSITLGENPSKVVECYKGGDVEFDTISPFAILSENITRDNWQALINCLEQTDFEHYRGVIILHGSDTLAYTSSIIANAFFDKNIVLTASDKPIDEPNSNGIRNFCAAVEHIKGGENGVFVSYDGIFKASCITSANINDRFFALESTVSPTGKRKISNKNVLIIKPYPEIDMSVFDFSNVDEILFEMYHSATVPKQIAEFCKNTDIPYHFVTHKSSADYITSSELKNIIFNCTIENAFAISILE